MSESGLTEGTITSDELREVGGDMGIITGGICQQLSLKPPNANWIISKRHIDTLKLKPTDEYNNIRCLGEDGKWYDILECIGIAAETVLDSAATNVELAARIKALEDGR